MRALSKVMTVSMLGAALLVSACGSNDTAEVNNTMTDVGTEAMDGTTNDVTAIDGAAATDANMAMDTNMTMDANATDANATVDANMTNGM